jgi:hypothetical protein
MTLGHVHKNGHPPVVANVPVNFLTSQPLSGREAAPVYYFEWLFLRKLPSSVKKPSLIQKLDGRKELSDLRLRIIITCREQLHFSWGMTQ